MLRGSRLLPSFHTHSFPSFSLSWVPHFPLSHYLLEGVCAIIQMIVFIRPSQADPHELITRTQVVPRCRLSAARCGGIAVYLPKLAMPNSAGVASSSCAPLHPAPEVWDTSSQPPCPSDTAGDCNKPVASSQAWLPHDAETGQEGVSRARSSISLQHLCLPGGLQANALLPGGSLVGLGICLAARCVGKKLLPLPTCRLFPCCLSVNGPLNSKPPEERRGEESLVTSALAKQTVPEHSQAQQRDCPHGNF